MTVLEMAYNYYPDFWSKDRIEVLVSVNKMTREEADKLYQDKGTKN